ncbi:MAG TPA: pseudouridine synthase [Terracidiphilus sp.]|nr:pseudouridine synthase [Terracidiphilus sp.]
MPKRAKKSAEAETPQTHPASETVAAAKAKAEAEAEEQPKKPARKTRSKKAEKGPSSLAELDDAGIVTAAATEKAAKADGGEAELAAQAAETFEDAFYSKAEHDAQSTAAAEPAPGPEKKKAVKKRASRKKPEPEPETQPQAQADEAGELEGDWESGSGEGQGQRDRGTKRQEADVAPKLERLQKILSRAGIASRRHAEEMIAGGRVQVNGTIVTELGSKADPARDHIRVDGKLLHGAERQRYFVLNKPRGYVTTVSDPEGRPTVMEFFSKLGERLYPVGRLDFQSEGLLLMTNDGELANQLTRAASEVEKTYLVKVSGQPGDDLIDALREGVRIDRGRPGEGSVRTAPARIRQVRQGENPWFEVGLIEGRNRELRKMFEEIGHHVEKIRRVGYGPLVLDLEPGKMRELDPEELRLLRLAAEGKWKLKRMKTSAMLPREAGRAVDDEGRDRGRKPFRRDDQRRDRRTETGGGRPWTGGGRSQADRAGGDRGYGDRQRERRGYGDRGGRPAFGGGQDRGQRQEGRGFVPGRQGQGRPGRSHESGGHEGRAEFGGQRRGMAGNRGPGRPSERDRSQRGGRGGAPPRGERPFRPRPEQGERSLRGKPEQSERPFRTRPEAGERPFRGRAEVGERPSFPRRGFEGGERKEGSADRGSRPARGGYRPERGGGQGRGFERGGGRGGRQAGGPGRRPEGGVQGRGQRGGFGQRFGQGSGRESTPRPGDRSGQGSATRPESRPGRGFGQDSGGGSRQGTGRPAAGPRGEGNRGRFAGRRSGPPKFGGRRPPGGNRGPRRP